MQNTFKEITIERICEEEKMAEEKVISIEEGTLAYTEEKDGIHIKRYRGMGTKAIVPEMIDNHPVIAIGRKAFLSRKTLQEIRLPDTIQEIGDWAFAHAEGLKRISIPRSELIRGKELFLGCRSLEEITLIGTEEECRQDKEDGIGRMLAAAVTTLHDYFLFTPTEIRSEAWMKRWDEQLLKLVRLDDLDGFQELWTCGEEDYEGKEYAMGQHGFARDMEFTCTKQEAGEIWFQLEANEETLAKYPFAFGQSIYH